jgi:excisionase family DNA binding protein
MFNAMRLSHSSTSTRRRAAMPHRVSNALHRAHAAEDRLLDVNEAAEMLGLSPKTLYQWAHEQRLPVVKLGSALRFRVSVLQQLIRNSERPARKSLGEREALDCP